MPSWKAKEGQKMLPKAIDVHNNCGYISLIKLEVADETESSNHAPHNGEMDEAKATLLQEEVDNIPNDKGKIPLTLAVDSNPGSRWMLLDVKFGIPLFDSDLNKSICQGIVINSLWKNESLESQKKTGKELCQLLNDFISHYQDLPLNDSLTKLWTTPEERRKSPVPFPTRVLFFDGHTLHEKI